MEISARNALKGTIKTIDVGAVNTEVVLEVAPGVEITAIITKASAERLGLSVGKAAYAVVKASDVMVACENG
ncbi:molybdopterin-binding protein [Leptolyngbya sp. 7M]|uniref:TOBE domain-containing protein n=1 Tax=Leptolyngbya sp. 7M TaxID=2812896 RepID=UPI001B8B412F|nr:molybdopterin-binding protein [Leptolyngbya sp. 7M]QYO68126.1 molybdopterin-binding protein [Leptolyngbya sp. 7M]